MTIEVIIFYILVVDSIGANLVALFGEKWYTKHFHILSKIFPAAKGWTIYYLILIAWVGFLLYRLGYL